MATDSKSAWYVLGNESTSVHFSEKAKIRQNKDKNSKK